MSDWPDIPYAPWAPTCAALHLQTQIVGNLRLAQTSWAIHAWHATIYAVPHGPTTGPIHGAGGACR